MVDTFIRMLNERLARGHLSLQEQLIIDRGLAAKKLPPMFSTYQVLVVGELVYQSGVLAEAQAHFTTGVLRRTYPTLEVLQELP